MRRWAFSLIATSVTWGGKQGQVAAQMEARSWRAEGRLLLCLYALARAKAPYLLAAGAHPEGKGQRIVKGLFEGGLVDDGAQEGCRDDSFRDMGQRQRVDKVPPAHNRNGMRRSDRPPPSCAGQPEPGPEEAKRTLAVAGEGSGSS